MRTKPKAPKKKTPERIISIASATHWYVQYMDEETGKDLKGDLQPLAVWALMESGEVKGMVECRKDAHGRSGIAPADDIAIFGYYKFLPKGPPEKD